MTDYSSLSDEEINVLVAERLMGWTAYAETRGEYTLAVAVRPGGRQPWKTCRHDLQEAKKTFYRQISCAEAQALGFFGIGFPDFATKIAHAWEVVEKMTGDGVVAIEVGEPTVGLVRVTIKSDPAAPAWITRGQAHAATAPRAICEAALAATEAE